MSGAAAMGEMMRAEDLDEAEFLHLALRATATDRHDEAISLLKRMAAAFPGNANAHYLLGAEHAQIGLYDRAFEELTEALRLQPQLEAARFQLGLLHLTSGHLSEAETVWSPLDQLAVDDPLRVFKSALVHLIHDELQQCARELRAGIGLDGGSLALKNDMERLLADVERRFAGDSVESSGTAVPLIHVPLPSSGIALKTYDRNRDGGAAD